MLDFSGVVETANFSSVEGWDEATHVKLQEQFNDCLQKAEEMFSSKGLKDLPDFRWERALLCIGDYLLLRGRNHSFLVNSQADQASWKRLLRGAEARKILRELWNRLNGTENLSAQLDAIIVGANNLEPWRAAFVQTPAAIKYCCQRLIRREYNGELYLLQTTQMNGTHAELFTYCLYNNILLKLCSSGPLKHTQLLAYYEHYNTEFEPGIMINFPYANSWLRFEIENKNDQFLLFIHCDKVEPYPLVEATLQDQLGFTRNITKYTKYSPHSHIQESLVELAEKLAATPTLAESNA